MNYSVIQVAAGAVSSMIFVSSSLPMVAKALRTKNLRSYSLMQIFLSNVGNLIYWLYVSSLPAGPVWFLHGFNTAVTALMLFWYIRYELGWPPVFEKLSRN